MVGKLAQLKHLIGSANASRFPPFINEKWLLDCPPANHMKSINHIAKAIANGNLSQPIFRYVPGIEAFARFPKRPVDIGRTLLWRQLHVLAKR